MEPKQPNTETAQEGEERFKTLGVRLGEELHAQLSFIAQLKGSTITDEIRRSIEARVTAAQNDPELVARAEEVRSQIEREASARREAIAGFFGQVSVEHAEGSATSTKRTSQRRGSSADADT